MTFKRLWQTFRLYTIRGSAARVEYIKKQHVYGAIGENCTIEKRKVPLYANLIKLGNNVHIASNVSFLTHDITYQVLNNIDEIKAVGGGTRENRMHRDREQCVCRIRHTYSV